MSLGNFRPTINLHMNWFKSCKKVIHWFGISTRDLDRHDAVRAASAMAFHAFFSLIPLVAISGWVVQKLTQMKASLLAPLLSIAPGSISELADSEFMRLSGAGETLLPLVSIIGFLWIATGGVAAGMRVFERIFEAPRRTWGSRRLFAFGFVLFSLLLFLASAWGILLASWVGSPFAKVAGIAIPLVALWMSVGIFFRYATRRHEGNRRRGFRGATVTMVLWGVESILFSYFVSEIARYTEFYGGLATVAILLAWLWLMSFSLIIGGEVNARIEGGRA